MSIGSDDSQVANEDKTGMETVVEHTIAPVTEPEPVEQLSDREVAIAQGIDPDTEDFKVEKPEEPGDDLASTEETQPTDGTGDTKVVPGKEAPPLPEEPNAEPKAAESTPADDNAAPPAKDGWVDDEVKALGASYGLRDEDIRSFKSREEFDRAAVIYDRNLVEQSRRQAATPPQPQPQPQPQPGTPPADQKPPELIDPQKYIEAGYDEETVNLVRAQRYQQEQNLALQQRLTQVTNYIGHQHQQEQIRLQEERAHRFHDGVDQLGPDRYGKTVNENGQLVQIGESHNMNRRRLHERATELMSVIEARARAEGRPVNMPPLPVILKRADALEFAEENRLASERAFQEKVLEQSRKRRPASGRGRTPAPAKGQDPDAGSAESLANDPELKKAWDGYQSENG